MREPESGGVPLADRLSTSPLTLPERALQGSWALVCSHRHVPVGVRDVHPGPLCPPGGGGPQPDKGPVSWSPYFRQAARWESLSPGDVFPGMNQFRSFCSVQAGSWRSVAREPRAV